MAEFISPQEKEEFMRRWGIQPRGGQLPPLEQEAVSLGRAGALAVPPEAEAPTGEYSPFRAFPEWQRMEREQLPRPGMTAYQPPGGPATYEEFMDEYTKKFGQREFEEVRPELAALPWITPIAGGQRGEVAAIGAGLTKGEKYQEAVRETVKLKAGLPVKPLAEKPRGEKIRLAVKDARVAAEKRIKAIVAGLGERGIPTTEEEWTAAFTQLPGKSKELTLLRTEAGRRRIAQEEMIRILKTGYGFSDKEARKIAVEEGARIHILPSGGGASPEPEEDKTALDWAEANPTDPRAKAIKLRLGR